MSGLKKHHSLKELARVEQNLLFSSVFLQSFSVSLIGIFVPIYLLKHGLGIQEVILYYLIHYAVCLPIASLGMLINQRWGIKKSMATGMLLLLCGYYTLSYVHGFDLAVIFATVLLAAGGTIYHLGYHIELTRSLDFKHEGKGLSMLYMCALGANLLGPLIGSLLISGVSFTFLIIIVGILLALAAWPLFLSADYKLPVATYNPVTIMQSGDKRQSIIFASQGAIKLAQDIFWPIFIYLIIKNIVGLGIITSLGSIAVIIVTYYIGKTIDVDNRKALKAGVASHVGSWGLKILFLSPIGIIFTNFASALANSLIENSFNKVVYGGAKVNKQQSTYFLYREYSMLLGRVATLSGLIFLTNLRAFFVFTSLLGLSMLLALADVKQVHSKA